MDLSLVITRGAYGLRPPRRCPAGGQAVSGADEEGAWQQLAGLLVLGPLVPLGACSVYLKEALEQGGPSLSDVACTPGAPNQCHWATFKGVLRATLPPDFGWLQALFGL